MADIVERLRESAGKHAKADRYVTDIRHGPTYSSLEPEQTIEWEAAAEITSLREEVGRLKGALRCIDGHLWATSGSTNKDALVACLKEIEHVVRDCAALDGAVEGVGSDG